MNSAYETEIPQMPKTIGYSSPQAALLSALAADPARHPERSHATLARVTEVIEIICNGNGDAGALASKCVAAAGSGHGLLSPVSNSTAAAVATAMAKALAHDQLERAIELLWQSELSTDEVIALHKKYKIPVSHLEDDLLPVKGDGALIFDSKGQKYIDLDSNYSATNLGNANPEIALGLFNQASVLVSQKEDRIQVARARFLKLLAEFRRGGGRQVPEDRQGLYRPHRGRRLRGRISRPHPRCGGGNSQPGLSNPVWTGRRPLGPLRRVRRPRCGPDHTRGGLRKNRHPRTCPG